MASFFRSEHMSAQAIHTNATGIFEIEKMGRSWSCRQWQFSILLALTTGQSRSMPRLLRFCRKAPAEDQVPPGKDNMPIAIPLFRAADCAAHALVLRSLMSTVQVAMLPTDVPSQQPGQAFAKINRAACLHASCCLFARMSQPGAMMLPQLVLAHPLN